MKIDKKDIFFGIEEQKNQIKYIKYNFFTWIAVWENAILFIKEDDRFYKFDANHWIGKGERRVWHVIN